MIRGADVLEVTHIPQTNADPDREIRTEEEFGGHAVEKKTDEDQEAEIDVDHAPETGDHVLEIGGPGPVIVTGDPDLVTVRDHALVPVTVTEANAANGQNHDLQGSLAVLGIHHLQRLRTLLQPKMMKILVAYSTPQRLTRRRQRNVWRQKCRSAGSG